MSDHDAAVYGGVNRRAFSNATSMIEAEGGIGHCDPQEDSPQ